MAEVMNYREMAERWADIVIERWIRKIQSLNIGSTGELLKSLEAQVAVDAKGDPQKITFLYLYYGIFTDMGVGKNVKLGSDCFIIKSNCIIFICCFCILF